MPATMQYPEVNLAEMREAIKVAIDTNRVLCLVGNPGIGKTQIIEATCRERGIMLRTLIGSSMAPEDLAIPRVNGDRVDRLPIGAIADLIANAPKPGALFLDEVTDILREVQAPLQRAINERWVGDREIPREVSILAACNDPSISTGGQELSLAFRGRITFLRVRPEISEVADYFGRMLGSRPGPFGEICADWAATLDVAPGMLELDPPAGVVAGQGVWASPRAWERGLDLFASAPAGLADKLLKGSVGEDPAVQYLAIRKVRATLPSCAEILADPSNARVPAPDSFAAIAGVISTVARSDPWAAWIYAGRQNPENRIVAGRICTRAPLSAGASSPHKAVGGRAKLALEAEVNRLQRAI